jgi:hypothetical protein
MLNYSQLCFERSNTNSKGKFLSRAMKVSLLY